MPRVCFACHTLCEEPTLLRNAKPKSTCEPSRSPKSPVSLFAVKPSSIHARICVSTPSPLPLPLFLLVNFAWSVARIASLVAFQSGVGWSLVSILWKRSFPSPFRWHYDIFSSKTAMQVLQTGKLGQPDTCLIGPSRGTKTTKTNQLPQRSRELKIK